MGNKEVDSYQIDDPNITKQAMSQFDGRQDPGVVSLQLDNSFLLYKMQMLLSGKIVIETPKGLMELNEGKKKPWLNELGITRTLTLLTKYTDKSVMLSNYDKVEINFKVFNICYMLLEHYTLHYQEYGLNPHDIPLLVSIIKDAVHDAYKRALGSGERVSIRSITNRTEVSNMINIPKEKGRLRK